MINEEKLSLPDDLIALWHYSHQSPGAITEQEAVRLFTNLKDSLVYAVKSIQLPDLNDEEAINDLVKDYIYGNSSYIHGNSSNPQMKIGLLQKPLRHVETKTKLSYLTRDIRKAWVQIHDPRGHELYQQISGAIHKLEKEGKIIRDSASKGKYLSNQTMLNLPGNPDQDSTFDNYQRNVGIISSYMEKAREETRGNSRIITPKVAKELVLKLLEAFGGWTSLGSIMSAAKKHTPSQFKIIKVLDIAPETTNDDEGKALDILSLNNDSNEDVAFDNDIDDFYARQGQSIVSEKSEQIWDMVCKVIEGDELFCLYFIPNQFKEYRTTESPQMNLEDFGRRPSTIGDRNKRLGEIWKRELCVDLKNKKHHCISESQQKHVREMAKQILINLLHRCKGIGCDPHLSIS